MSAPTEFYPITGIQEGLDSSTSDEVRQVPLRMEVDEWFKSDKNVHVEQRALFFPAFWKLSHMSPQEKISWYQIAGIHGRPYVAWDEESQSKNEAGYCTHNSILFSTWHRPYMLLWEQVIYEFMKEEAENFPLSERASLLESAKSWRFPYWDWALKKEDPSRPGKYDYSVPLVIQSPKVTIKGPVGPRFKEGFGEVDNAFYQFAMPGRIPMGHSSLESLSIKPVDVKDGGGKTLFRLRFDRCVTTTRHVNENGTEKQWIDGEQNNNGIVQMLRDYKMTTLDTEEISKRGNLTSQPRKPGKGPEVPDNNKKYAFDSAESIHDNVHYWCGGDLVGPDVHDDAFVGHMSQVEVAAFDPLFWLHHCNVDRLIAIWQVLHPDSWFAENDDQNIDGGNFFIEKLHEDKSTDALHPFHDSSGNYYTSDAIREVAALGYTYKDLEKWLYLDAKGKYDNKKHRRELNPKLLKLYGSSWKAAQASHFSDDPGQNTGVGLMSFDEYEKDPVDLIGTDDYVFDVVYEKFALNGRTFTIHVFIGEVPTQPPYEGKASLVGQIVNFSTILSNSSSVGCGNCRAQESAQALSSGRVILTNALITRWKNQVSYTSTGPERATVLRGMDPDNVLPFLKDNLHWRVTSLGEEVDIATQLPSLRVSLAVGKADHFADRSKMSRFYDYKDAHVVTEGRPGGATHDDGLHWSHWDCDDA